MHHTPHFGSTPLSIPYSPTIRSRRSNSHELCRPHRRRHGITTTSCPVTSRPTPSTAPSNYHVVMPDYGGVLELPFGNPNDYARSGHLHSTATVPESSSSLSYLHCITYD